MWILLNNREEEFLTDKMTVTEMLEIKKYSYKMRIVKINGILISKDHYSTTLINENDNVQMLYLMSGG